jgi:hypothetical protein
MPLETGKKEVSDSFDELAQQQQRAKHSITEYRKRPV